MIRVTTWDAKAPTNIGAKVEWQGDLEVTCRKMECLMVSAEPFLEAAGSMFGNIIFGGGIGALIEKPYKGTGYDYIRSTAVKMGVVVVDKANTQQQASK